MNLTRVAARFVRLATLGGTLVLANGVGAEEADPRGVAEAFAVRLANALQAGAIEQDRLWQSGARDASHQVLDARTASLFRWSDVAVTIERAAADGDDVVVDLVIRGTATWDGRAFGVASALWTLQLDEQSPANSVVRRETWRIRRADGVWGAVDRGVLPAVDVLSATIDAGVFPGQQSMLVECTYYLRARVEGVRVVRMLLDRRSRIYDLRVNGTPAPVVRGGELGALGLLGYTPELESSFSFPKPLAPGEEVLVKFRILAPVAHLERTGFLTTLPIQDGPFRQRAWVPILVSDEARASATKLDLSVHWPEAAFDEIAAPCAAGARADDVESSRPEETGARFRWSGDLREVDFLLRARGAAAPAALELRSREDANGAPAACFTGQSTSLRTRRALVQPLLDASTYSTRDLSSELQDLLPLDDQILDELFDDSSGDAEQGADDRSAG
jgi:hypothetical protein